jgi:cation/acetate symporter
MALFWRRFNTTGAVAGVLGGLTVAVVLIVLSPPVWPGPDSHGSPVALHNPAIISIPAGFLCCWLGTMLGSERATERSYHELQVRAEVGIGAE